jgi:hypothetical protein
MRRLPKDAAVQSSEVWVNPNSTFKGPRGNRAWEHRLQSPPTTARLLELADIALGQIHPPAVKKKKTAV